MLSHSLEQYVLRVMNGQARGPAAASLRALLSLIEPIYRSIIYLRNRRFDSGYGVQHLSKPVISVGNLTAGGTGKTPVVRWLCQQLLQRSHHPAVLMRGYKSTNGQSDEQRMLQSALGASVIIHANPDRVAGGTEVLAQAPAVDAFILDDGFQHRRLARNFDLVLISATEPFGFGHVHPRGLLREPLASLARASAILITRADTVADSSLASLERQIRLHNQRAPIYCASHVHTALRFESEPHPMEALAHHRVFAFCGIGSPESFLNQFPTLCGSRTFPDHHPYTEADLQSLDDQATRANATLMLTTEKDGSKLANLPASSRIRIPIWQVDMAIHFRSGDEQKLIEQILSVMPQGGTRASPTHS
jgi:tetraacyldisaccharide 4'-kinase